MNDDQLLKQMRYLLRQATWADSPNGTLFANDNVFNSSGFDASRLGETGFPFAVVAPGAAEPFRENENPRLQLYNFAVHVFSRHEGDRLGQFVLHGGQRAATTGSRANRGLLELQREIARNVEALGPANGVSVSCTKIAEPAPELVQGTLHVLRGEVAFQGLVGRPTYPPPYEIGGDGSPTVNLYWTHALPRFDRVGVHLRRIAGSTAPTLSTGTLVGNYGTGTTSANDAPGAGTWTYGLWATYNESGDGVAVERYSDRAVTLTTTV